MRLYLLRKKLASNKMVHDKFNTDLKLNLKKYIILNPTQVLTCCLKMCCKRVKYWVWL